MDDLSKIRAFIEAVDRGGFTAAARQAEVAVSSIARQVKALEDDLGARLINRTTRSQSLTEAGRLFYDRMVTILRDFEGAKHDVMALRSTVTGTLKVTIRTSTSGIIIPALPVFLAKHPELSLDISVTDERLDLVAEGIDIAVWLGEMQDSSLVSRRLAYCKRVLVGSPHYFERHGEPKSPGDLVHHNCLVYRALQYQNIWKFENSVEKVEIPVKGNLRSATGLVLMQSALAGLGLILVQEFHAGPELQAGRLKSVLDQYRISPTTEDTSLYLVYPSARGLSVATRAFIEFLVEQFKPEGAATRKLD
ncbi:LysR family transcriptional regulator [Sphingobium sp. EP60837]|uniref:LysR family transcriptional regulator n=1 Tax=Sphingobium sp. EP60837 TaxID=1855519 RepID=UPI0007DE27C0|nr:LysR family transcriptional regulator [Sphingobium sp. EP60837]ANI80115.1 Iron-regulated virulence regulatory protein IrgB [Sphingobium sp. EP60837]